MAYNKLFNFVFYITMRKILSIFFALLTILGSFHFALATHFCGGKMVDYDLGLGKVEASCGMENGNSPCSEKETYGNNCCKNYIESYTGTDNFTFSIQKSFIQHSEFHLFETALQLPDLSSSLLPCKNSFFQSPPNIYFTSLPFLRVFRI